MTRVVRFIRKSRWIEHFDDVWLDAGDIPADPLGDLTTQNNTLSIYLINNQSDLERWAAAITTTKDSVSVVDYAIFELSLLQANDVKSKPTLGETADDLVNSWHNDVIELSARKVVALAQLIHDNADIERIAEKKIDQLLVEGAVAGYFKRNAVKKPKMQTRIDELLSRANHDWA